MKRILSIDGGGIRGIIPAFVCCEIEKFYDKPLYELCDMIAGTSTGGIIALGLARKIRAEELLKLYCEQGNEIFNKPKRSVTQYFRPKYEPDGLEKLLKKFFKEDRLSDLSDVPVEIVITSYDISNRVPLIVTSWNVEEDSEKNFKLRDIARATSAAPTYFKPTKKLKNSTAIDGGIYCNNPSLIAYAEGRKMWPNDHISLVSLGTGALTPSILYDEAENWGKAKWVRPVIACAQDGVCKITHEVLQGLSEFEAIKLKLRVTDSCMEFIEATEVPL